MVVTWHILGFYLSWFTSLNLTHHLYQVGYRACVASTVLYKGFPYKGCDGTWFFKHQFKVLVELVFWQKGHKLESHSLLILSGQRMCFIYNSIPKRFIRKRRDGAWCFNHQLKLLFKLVSWHDNIIQCDSRYYHVWAVKKYIITYLRTSNRAVKKVRIVKRS